MRNHSWGTRSTKASWLERSISSSGTVTSVIVGLLEVMQVLVDLPVRHPGAVALDLEPLHGEERVDDLRAHSVAQHVVGLQRVESIAEGVWQLPTGLLFGQGIGVTANRRAERQLLAHAVQPCEQDRGGSAVRVRAAIAHPDLDPRGPSSLGRYADESRAVVPAPVGVCRRQRVGDEPPVGVYGGVQE